MSFAPFWILFGPFWFDSFPISDVVERSQIQQFLISEDLLHWFESGAQLFLEGNTFPTDTLRRTISVWKREILRCEDNEISYTFMSWICVPCWSWFFWVHRHRGEEWWNSAGIMFVWRFHLLAIIENFLVLEGEPPSILLVRPTVMYLVEGWNDRALSF